MELLEMYPMLSTTTVSHSTLVQLPVVMVRQMP